MWDLDRKVLCIMRILSNSPEEALGARVISHRLQDFGIELGERAVRYHLRQMDERGLTCCVGREGRKITETGMEEIKNYTVRDKVGFITAKIEQLSWQTNFDLDKCMGTVPVNIACFPKEKFQKALNGMKPVFKNGLYLSDMVAVAREGQLVGHFTIPQGKIALVTVSTALVNGVFLKAGIHVEPKFSGILQMRNGKPVRFLDLILYAGCSLNPAELFITAKMTTVHQVARSGSGRVLASFREIPDYCWTKAQDLLARLKQKGMGGLLLMGGPNEPLCGITPEPNRVGMVLLSGFNPSAAAAEAGVDVESHTLSEVADYDSLVKFSDVYKMFMKQADSG
jgi:repressor of nif and glnA expression